MSTENRSACSLCAHPTLRGHFAPAYLGGSNKLRAYLFFISVDGAVRRGYKDYYREGVELYNPILGLFHVLTPNFDPN